MIGPVGSPVSGPRGGRALLSLPEGRRCHVASGDRSGERSSVIRVAALHVGTVARLPHDHAERHARRRTRQDPLGTRPLGAPRLAPLGAGADELERRGRKAEHSARGAREVRGVREPGAMRRRADRASRHEQIPHAQEAPSEDVRLQRHPGLRHETKRPTPAGGAMFPRARHVPGEVAAGRRLREPRHPLRRPAPTGTPCGAWVTLRGRALLGDERHAAGEQQHGEGEPRARERGRRDMRGSGDG